MSNTPIIRVSVTSLGDRLVSAVLQERISMKVEHGVHREQWRDLRPLHVTPDGEIILSTVQHSKEEE